MNTTAETRSRGFGELITAMVTPFIKEGSLDLDQTAELALKLVNEGSDSLVVTGTSGETSTLTDSENVAMFRAVIDAVEGKAKVIAGVGSNDTAHTIALARRAAAEGVDGLLLATPYYNKPSQSGLIAHFERIADEVALPVMLYDIPHRSGVPLHAETIIALASHPNIWALKDAKGDFAATTQVLSETNLDVYAGDDGLVLPLMAIGAVGLVSTTANIAAPVFRQLIDAARAGDLDTARRLNFELAPLIRSTMTHVQGAVAVKTILHWQGVLPNAIVRLPLVEPDSEEAALIRDDLSKTGIVH